MSLESLKLAQHKLAMDRLAMFSLTNHRGDMFSRTDQKTTILLRPNHSRYTFRPNHFRLTHDVGLDNFDADDDNDMTPIGGGDSTFSPARSLSGGAKPLASSSAYNDDDDGLLLSDVNNENDVTYLSSTGSLRPIISTDVSNIYASSSLDLIVNLKNAEKSKQLENNGYGRISGTNRLDSDAGEDLKSVKLIGGRDEFNDDRPLLIGRDLRIEDFARIGSECVKVNLNAKKNDCTGSEYLIGRRQGHVSRRLPKIPSPSGSPSSFTSSSSSSSGGSHCMDKQHRGDKISPKPINSAKASYPMTSLADELLTASKNVPHKQTYLSLADELSAAVQSESSNQVAANLNPSWFPKGYCTAGNRCARRLSVGKPEELGSPELIDPVNKYDPEDWSQVAYWICGDVQRYELKNRNAKTGVIANANKSCEARERGNERDSRNGRSGIHDAEFKYANYEHMMSREGEVNPEEERGYKDEQRYDERYDNKYGEEERERNEKRDESVESDCRKSCCLSDNDESSQETMSLTRVNSMIAMTSIPPMTSITTITSIPPMSSTGVTTSQPADLIPAPADLKIPTATTILSPVSPVPKATASRSSRASLPHHAAEAGGYFHHQAVRPTCLPDLVSNSDLGSLKCLKRVTPPSCSARRLPQHGQGQGQGQSSRQGAATSSNQNSSSGKRHSEEDRFMSQAASKQTTPPTSRHSDQPSSSLSSAAGDRWSTTKEAKNYRNLLMDSGIMVPSDDGNEDDDDDDDDDKDGDRSYSGSGEQEQNYRRSRSQIVEDEDCWGGKDAVIERRDSSRTRSPVRKSFFTLSGKISPDLYLDETDATHRGCHKFVPRHPEELAIEIGDPIYVDDEADDLWCEGFNLRTRQRGVFPTVYATDLSILNQGEKRLAKFFVKFLGSIEVNHHQGNEVLCQAVNKLVAQRKKTMETSPPTLCSLQIDEHGIKMEDRSKRKLPFSRFTTSTSVTERLSRLLSQDGSAACVGRDQIMMTSNNDHFFATKNICFCGSHPKNDKYLGFITKHPVEMRFACHVFQRDKSTKDIAEAIGLSLTSFYQEYLACVHPTEDIYIE